MANWMDAYGADRRSFLKGTLALGAAAAMTGSLAACSSDDKDDSKSSTGTKSTIDGPADVAAAKKEGKLQLIAYPVTWANYGGHFAAFKAKYGIDIQVANPDGSSAEELQAVKTLKGQKTQPDVLDIGYTFTDTARTGGLIEQYKPANFASIPDSLKDPDGWWVGAYYGVMSLGVNTKGLSTVPTTFADLLKPEFKGKVMTPGDPRSAAGALAAVFAAAIANGGSADDISPGIEYFAELKKSGNLVTASSVQSALSTGQAAIAFDWNYNWVGSAETLTKSGVDLKQVVPSDGVFGSYYAQPLTIKSPQPNAGRLWIDWLTSDEGSEQYALGGAVPARFTELAGAKKLSDKALATLPDPAIVAQVKFPTIAQGAAATKTVVADWGPKVLNS